MTYSPPDPDRHAERLLDLARAVLDTESAALSRLRQRLDASFVTACDLMLACTGRVVVLGMGKSGHIGGKIAATLASTGTPAFFVHPGEASHGDLGMITGRDLVLALSNSGETAELLTLLPVIKRFGVPLVAMTGRPDSTLARAADVHLEVSVEKEACPLGLAPTASTTAALAMGDALAVALLESRGFTAEDFALSHPGGALGRRLLLRIDDVMHTGEAIPRVGVDAALVETLHEITRKGLGMTAVVDAQGRLQGVFTDGDLRRAVDLRIDLHRTPVGEHMSRDPVTIAPGGLAAEALALMEARRVNGLLVVDPQDGLVGVLGMHDLLRAGVV